MNRFHLHLKVSDLAQAKAFYSALFDMSPTVEKDDYIKWMVEDPRMNFAISPTSGGEPGINHLGLQVDSDAELAVLEGRLEKADARRQTETGANCCYSSSNKHWALDPDNNVWEMFHTMGAAKIYGADIGASDALKSASNVKEKEGAPTAGCC